MKYLPLLWSGIWRKPGRAVLALVQISLAFALFGMLQGFTSGIQQSIAAIDADVVWVRSHGSASELPLALYQRILRVPGVKVLSYTNYFGARYQIPTQQLLVIVAEPRDWAEITHDVAISPADVEALAHTRTGAIVGGTLMRKYSWKIGQRIPMQADVPREDGSNDWAFDIVGTLELTDPPRRDQSNMIVINYSYFDEARAIGTGGRRRESMIDRVKAQDRQLTILMARVKTGGWKVRLVGGVGKMLSFQRNAIALPVGVASLAG